MICGRWAPPPPPLAKSYLGHQNYGGRNEKRQKKKHGMLHKSIVTSTDERDNTDGQEKEMRESTYLLQLQTGCNSSTTF